MGYSVGESVGGSVGFTLGLGAFVGSGVGAGVIGSSQMSKKRSNRSKHSSICMGRGETNSMLSDLIFDSNLSMKIQYRDTYLSLYIGMDMFTGI